MKKVFSKFISRLQKLGSNVSPEKKCLEGVTCGGFSQVNVDKASRCNSRHESIGVMGCGYLRDRFCKMHFLGSVGERVRESYKAKVPAMRVALKELRNELDLGSVSAGIPLHGYVGTEMNLGG